MNDILKKYHQEQLLEFYETLSATQQQQLLNQIQAIDFAALATIYDNMNTEQKSLTLEPLQANRWEDYSESEREHFHQQGMELLSAGKVGVLVVAGGQGSRLGHAGPKGTFDIGLPSHKSLFQLQAERILNLSKQAGRTIPWYIMTSPDNHEDTVAFFEQHHFFGYPQSELTFFQQDVIPAVDLDGKVLLKTASTVCMVPNGNGGCFSALRRAGGMAELKKRGVEWLFYYNVDNALIKPADPYFVGFASHFNHPIASKVIERTNPEEKVGVLGLKNGRPAVIEYTELPDELKNARDDSGALLYRNANISIHLFRLDFVEEMADTSLPYQVARKKIETVHGKVDAFKYELFFFDTFPFADSMSVVMAQREEEFAPLKNATGPDSPETARELVLRAGAE